MPRAVLATLGANDAVDHRKVRVIPLQRPAWKGLALKIRARFKKYRDYLFDRLASSRYLKRAIYRSLSRDGKLVFSQFADHRILVDSNDVVGRNLLEEGDFGRARTELVAQRARDLGRKTTVIEIGANIGTQTLYFLVSGLFDRVVCLEPDPANVRLLNLNIRLNDLEQKVEVLPVGAGDRAGVLALRRLPGNSGGSTLRSEQVLHSLATDIQVPIVTIDSLIEDGTVDPETIGLIWIDAEGLEEEIFAGCRILIERRVPIAFEFSTAFYDADKGARIIDLVFACYAEVSLVEENGFRQTTKSELLGLKRQVDLFCCG